MKLSTAICAITATSIMVATNAATTRNKQQAACVVQGVNVFDGCDFDTVLGSIESYVKSHKSWCNNDVETELLLFTRTNSVEEAKLAINDACATGWQRSVKRAEFTAIDSSFTESFMNRYSQGDTFLNLETGNFQGKDNPQFPSSAETRRVGENVDAFRNLGWQMPALESFGAIAECKHQSIMCCFGRDRQSNDDNGNCADNNCQDADPADNSNLCYVEEPDFMSYEDTDEGDVHCHGFAWSDDPNSMSVQYAMNNFFYISLYDHMYTRGYVENMVDNPSVPMCGCIEKMPAVTRADCTEIDGTASFHIYFDSNTQKLQVNHRYSQVTFNACQGVMPGSSLLESNDLASHVNRLVIEGKMSKQNQDEIHKTLVGYTNVNDDNNPEACSAAIDEFLFQ